MSWETTKFSSLYAIESRNGLTKPSRVRGSGYKMINMGELFSYDRIYDIPMELVPLNDREKASSKVESGDLLFARQSLVLEGAGKCSIVMDVSPLTVFESHLIRVRLDQTKANPLFFYYYFKSPQSPIKSIVSQCAQSGIRGSDLGELRVALPALKMQNKIADILSAYDNLIENNQKQIKLLEEAAQRLYKEWFVDLRFPGYENTPIIDGVPQGWKKVSLGELIEYEIGGGWGEDQPTEKCDLPAYVIRGTDLYDVTHGNAKSIPYRFHSKSILDSRKLQDGDIVFEVSGGSKNEGVARTALITESLLDFLGDDVICASFCKLIRFKDKGLAKYMYDTFQYLRNSRETVKYDKRSASSIVNYRWKDFLEQQLIFVPTDDVLMHYNALAENMQKAIVNKAQIIEQAKQARDRLLPKLTSGELEV